MKKKKKKAKKEPIISLKYTGRALPFVLAQEFTFEEKPVGKLSIIAIDLPNIATVVVGKGGDMNGVRLCWMYKSGTPLKEAVSQAFREILERASTDYALAAGIAKGKKKHDCV